jgi:Gas vesicle protein
MVEPVAQTSAREVALVDLLDRLLAGGVVLSGDITLSLADVDLVHLYLRLLLTPAGETPAGLG